MCLHIIHTHTHTYTHTHTHTLTYTHTNKHIHIHIHIHIHTHMHVRTYIGAKNCYTKLMSPTIIASSVSMAASSCVVTTARAHATSSVWVSLALPRRRTISCELMYVRVHVGGCMCVCVCLCVCVCVHVYVWVSLALPGRREDFL